MAQLVKLQDYVSRYENNLYHYQSLFTRIKENRWKDFKQNKVNLNQHAIHKEFRNRLFTHQMNWATSTVKEVSNWDKKYIQNRTLRFMIQEVPDNYFLFYEPVLQVKNAGVELDVILVGPADVWLIVWMTGEGIWQEAQNNKRFWKNVDSDQKETVLSPIIRLERMISMVREYWEPYQNQISLKPCIVAPHAFIDFSNDWRKIAYIDKRNFKEWYAQLQQNPAPIKSQQLKFVSDLLSLGVTNSLYRKDPLSNESEFHFEGI
ncbi:hypothetical protein AWM68_10840 [Fictibacillus phosphorivorans]|uniref:NERD domain-containing protein n=1 Tax=Fictibacillus phosphorivorans TaxID=1221500 RepID=A0A163Q6Q6_9BACL|nr:hypothetical protein [Fictibacillus phosphorivorans]KZE64629.1 hypothetical protein AWM68_10840 [Fictibacillus phosphorivorans]